MDIGRSITFVFDDEDWITKVLIGGVISFLGLVGIIVIVGPFIATAALYGYMLDVISNVRRGDPRPLPAWDDLGGKIVDGFKLLVAQLVWSLPMIVLYVPIVIFASLADQAGNGGGVWAIPILCLTCFLLLYGLFFGLVTPAIAIAVAERRTIGAGLDISAVISRTRRHLAEVVVVVIFLAVLQVVAQTVGVVLCFVGVFLTMAWVYMPMGHLYGQIAARDTGRQEPQAPLPGVA